MRLSHNIPSLNIYRQYSKHLVNQSSALEKISSGYKIARAKDNPNVMAQSEQLKIQVRGLQMAAKNTQDAVSMLQTADGAAQNISEIIIRIKELLLSAGGSQTDESLEAIQGEIDQMIEGIDNIAKFSEFNGIKLLAEKGSTIENPKNIDLLCGGTAGEITKIPKYDLTANGLELDKGAIDVKYIDSSIEKIDKALNITNASRSKHGALTNRLDSTFTILNEVSSNTEGAEAELTGADISLEIIEHSKHSLLIESSLALMIQTNKMPQDILTILQNVRGR